jgi:cation diffusion facilitator family transporter
VEQPQRIASDQLQPQTRRLYASASLIAIVGNIVLLAAKSLAARASQSSAIYADAANSAGDVAYSLLMGFGLWLSLRPPDVTHPRGHRRIEPLVSLIIGGMMAFVGYEAVRSGVSSLRRGPESISSIWAYLAPIGVVLVKGGMFVVVRRIGRAAHSGAIEATAQDNLSDMVSSALALLGVAASRYLAAWADPVAAFVVALWIFRSAFGVLRTGLQQLIGGSASPELVETITDLVRAVPGVLDVYQVIIDYAGPQVYVDIHIAMGGSTTLDTVHAASHVVRRAVKALPEVGEVFVHVEPPGPARTRRERR